MVDNTNFGHWATERDKDGILWLVLDKQGAGANTLSADVIGELDVVLAAAEKALPKGLVIRSAKPGGFIAGADIKEFLRLQSHAEAAELIRRCHRVFDRLEKMDCPTVSLIHGYCLGGGLELALATRYRIVEDDPRTRLGLPEVRLGIHPGFGGTVRAPRLIGHMRALEMMLSGRSLDVRAARKLGLVDHVTPQRHLLRAARQIVLNPPPPHRPPLLQRLAGWRLVRPQVARLMRRKLAGKVPERHYPAPYALIDVWQKHADNPRRMLEEEANSVARLIIGDTAQNLIRVFFLQERLKSLGREAGADVRHVHVIGAGVMGGDIAAWCVVRVSRSRSKTVAGTDRAGDQARPPSFSANGPDKRAGARRNGPADTGYPRGRRHAGRCRDRGHLSKIPRPSRRCFASWNRKQGPTRCWQPIRPVSRSN